MRQVTDDAFNNILETCGQANFKFLALLNLVRELDRLACEGDKNAEQALEMTVFRFNRLIETAEKLAKSQ